MKKASTVIKRSSSTCSHSFLSVSVYNREWGDDENGRATAAACCGIVVRRYVPVLSNIKNQLLEYISCEDLLFHSHFSII